jgi:hypothetical protein
MKAKASHEGVDGAVEGTAAEKAVKEVAADVRLVIVHILLAFN